MRSRANSSRDLSAILRNAMIVPPKKQTTVYWYEALSFSRDFSKEELITFLTSKGHWIYPEESLFTISAFLFPKLYDYLLDRLAQLDLNQEELIKLFFAPGEEKSNNIIISILNHWTMATDSTLSAPLKNMNIDSLKKTFDFLCPRLNHEVLIAEISPVAKLLILPGDSVDFLRECVESLSRNNASHQKFLTNCVNYHGSSLIFKMALAKNYKLMSYLAEVADDLPKKQIDSWPKLAERVELSDDPIVISELDAYFPVCIDSDKEKTLPLFWAVKKGFVKLVQQLLSMGVDINTSYENETALVVAIKSHQHACLEYLLASKASFKSIGIDFSAYYTPLLIAIRLKDLRACELLVAAGEDPCRDFYQNLIFNQDMLGYVASFGSLEILVYLQTKGVQGNVSAALRTALMYRQPITLIQFLMAQGAVVDASLLHDAINGEYPEAVNLILSCGVDPNERVAGETALEKAQRIGNADLIWVLEKNFTERFFKQWVAFCFMFCKQADPNVSGKLVADLFLDKWLLPGSMRPERVYLNCARIFDRVSKSYQDHPTQREPRKPLWRSLGQNLGWR